jgi:hypothetical protein
LGPEIVRSLTDWIRDLECPARRDSGAELLPEATPLGRVHLPYRPLRQRGPDASAPDDRTRTLDSATHVRCLEDDPRPPGPATSTDRPAPFLEKLHEVAQRLVIDTKTRRVFRCSRLNQNAPLHSWQARRRPAANRLSENALRRLGDRKANGEDDPRKSRFGPIRNIPRGARGRTCLTHQKSHGFGRSRGTACGRTAPNGAFSWAFGKFQVLKRNSTTSPSCIT